ncbi:MAG: Uma2 family endonuclease [Planctomycetes bacterium]|nr:Uma2 family endonuclease [Planctomycetota bacterium]
MTTVAIRHSALGVSRAKLTYDDYVELSRDRRCELLDGELIMPPAPGTPHQRTSIGWFVKLHLFVKRGKPGTVFIAPYDVVLSRHTTVQPDLLFISKERESIITEANVQGAPDWVAEIVSPDSVERDRVMKKRLYARHGVREYWIIDPAARSIDVYLLEKGAYRLAQRVEGKGKVTSTVISGFCVSVQAMLPPARKAGTV